MMRFSFVEALERIKGMLLFKCGKYFDDFGQGIPDFSGTSAEI
jgi:hypothetical protein